MVIHTCYRRSAITWRCQWKNWPLFQIRNPPNISPSVHPLCHLQSYLSSGRKITQTCTWWKFRLHKSHSLPYNLHQIQEVTGGMGGARYPVLMIGAPLCLPLDMQALVMSILPLCNQMHPCLLHGLDLEGVGHWWEEPIRSQQTHPKLQEVKQLSQLWFFIIIFSLQFITMWKPAFLVHCLNLA